MDSSELVNEQYATTKSLETRITIHDKYSTNKMGFDNWLFSHYGLSENSRILELGGGNGFMWKNRYGLLTGNRSLVLTDASEAMVAAARESLGEHPSVRYEVVNIEDIPYEDHSFDVVIANMMLYHVQHMEKALTEVRRVLKPDGVFYAATYGENGILSFVERLLSQYGVQRRVDESKFTLQNGADALIPFFLSVKRENYLDSLEVTRLDDFLDYIYSLGRISDLWKIERSAVKSLLFSRMRNGILYVPKEYGMFIASGYGKRTAE